MREELAEKLLAKVMEWSPSEVAQNRPELEVLARIKYDEYQQFSPGMRFIESLAIWLKQMESSERKIAFEYLKKKLIFISSKELNHLIGMIYKDYVRPILINKAALKLNIPQYHIKKITLTEEFQALLNQCLFLGLSDGARIDVLRRYNPEIDHEQVFPIYLIEKEKVAELSQMLGERMQSMRKNGKLELDDKFKTLFLLDDFTASGLSYIRKENGSSYKGKLVKVINKIKDLENIGSILDFGELEIHIIIYISTEFAFNRLKAEMAIWLKESALNYKVTFHSVQILENLEKINEDQDIMAILEKYFDDAILTPSYKKGKHEKPFLGYDECGLSIILNHNTPNNSVPLLWFEEGKKYNGLFPRVARHKK